MAKKKVEERNLVSEALVAAVETVKLLCEAEGVDLAEAVGIEAEDEEDEEEDEEEGEDEDEEGAEDVAAFIAELTDVAELTTIAKALKVKVGTKDKAEVISKNILKKDEEEIRAALETLGYFEEAEEGEDEDEDEDEETAIDAEEILNGAELDDLKAVAKTLKIKLDAKPKKKDIIAKILEKDEDKVVEALEAAGLVGEEDEEVTEEDVRDALVEMSVGDLKKLAKAMEIDLTKKAKTSEQIATEIMDASDYESVYTALDENGFLDGDEE